MSKFLNEEIKKLVLRKRAEESNMNGLAEALKTVYSGMKEQETRLNDIESQDVQMRQQVSKLILSIDRRLTIALYLAIFSSVAVVTAVLAVLFV